VTALISTITTDYHREIPYDPIVAASNTLTETESLSQSTTACTTHSQLLTFQQTKPPSKAPIISNHKKARGQNQQKRGEASYQCGRRRLLLRNAEHGLLLLGRRRGPRGLRGSSGGRRRALVLRLHEPFPDVGRLRPQKTKQEPLSRRRRPRTGNRIKNPAPLAKQISAEGEYQPARKREREREGKNALTISDAAMDGPGRPKSWRFFRILGAVRLVGELGF
jgi:hypothetical protein